MKTWKMIGPGRGDKSFFLHGPVISLEVDYDDVDHDATLKEARRILEVLNSSQPIDPSLEAGTDVPADPDKELARIEAVAMSNSEAAKRFNAAADQE